MSPSGTAAPGPAQPMEGSAMKAFLSAVVAAIVIAVVAAFALDWLDQSSATVYQSEQGNVRL